MTEKATPRPWMPHTRQITGKPTHYYGSAVRFHSNAHVQCCDKHEHRGSHAALVCAVNRANALNMRDHDHLTRMAQAGEELVKATKALQANASALADELSENNTDTRSLWLEDDEVVLAASVQAIAAYEEASREGPR